MRRVSEKTCLKCGYRWLPRSVNRPGVCPICKHRKWDEPKQAKP